MKFDTKVVRSGISPDPSTGAIVPPIYQSATYVLEEVGKDKGYDYTRANYFCVKFHFIPFVIKWY